MADYGEFEEIIEPEKQNTQISAEQETTARVRMPRNGEFIGVILQRLGGNRMEVLATDGKTRNCRVPGRYKRSLWLRSKDIVLIQPWPDDNSKGDVIFKYNSSAIIQLRKKGILNSIRVEF
ncbi:MAG: translation initiation factor eIF-1A [Nanoarchaeota archaeon]